MPEFTPQPSEEAGPGHSGGAPPPWNAACESGLPAVGREDRFARAARSLEAQAVVLRFGIIPALVVSALVILVSTTDRPAALVILIAGVGVVGSSLASSLLVGLAALVRVGAMRAEGLVKLERSLTEGLQHIAATVESSQPVPSTGTAQLDVSGVKARHLAEIRHAIRSRLWDESSTLVAAFTDTHPDDPEAPRLAAELAGARTVARDELLARIEAARQVNEAERVIELRDELKPLAHPDALGVLDRDLAKWLMMLIHRRLRTGTVRLDVAVLAGRVSASFDQTPEGASLRASLPTLRRAAGLCPRCAQPYTGVADACPACLAGPSAAAAQTTLTDPALPNPDDPDAETDRLDLGDHGAIEYTEP